MPLQPSRRMPNPCLVQANKHSPDSARAGVGVGRRKQSPSELDSDPRSVLQWRCMPGYSLGPDHAPFSVVKHGVMACCKRSSFPFVQIISCSCRRQPAARHVTPMAMESASHQLLSAPVPPLLLKAWLEIIHDQYSSHCRATDNDRCHFHYIDRSHPITTGKHADC